MNKVLFWFTWGLAFIVLNLAAFPIAAFILYGVREDAGVFSVPFMRVVGLFLLINLITLQMLIAGRKENKRGFGLGLIVAVMQLLGLLIFISTISTGAVVFMMLLFVFAAVLLVKEIRRRRY